MREIKFRAWHKEKGWTERVVVYGDGSWSATYENIEGYSGDDGVVLVQYTGLQDKHGREIYEGDILKSVPTKWLVVPYILMRVVWCQDEYSDWNATFGVIDINIPAHSFSTFQQIRNSQLFPVEIIGNIYEHPELLQGLSS